MFDDIANINVILHKLHEHTLLLLHQMYNVYSCLCAILHIRLNCNPSQGGPPGCKLV